MQQERIAALLADLNPAQQQAVQIVEGPALVVAGAGSGKTRVITYRIPFLIFSEVAQPESMLGLKFQNKAGGEMKTPNQILSENQFQATFSSKFRSFGALFLARDIEALGYSGTFLIYDEDDQLSVIRECCREL